MKVRQKFRIVDPVSGKFVGVKGRVNVHRDGDWHNATNAFIVRKSGRGGYEILVQERSLYVDIAQGKLDQSVATQVLVEDGDNDCAIRRGLFEELGLIQDDIVRIERFNKTGSMSVVKKYSYNKDLYNRELVDMFGVLIKSEAVFKPCVKIDNLKWLGWEEFSNLVLVNPSVTTKTVRMFCVNEKMRRVVVNFFANLIGGKKIDLFRDQYHYFSYEEIDVDFLIDSDGRILGVYNTGESIKQIDRIKNVNVRMLQTLREVGFEALLKEVSLDKKEHISINLVN